MSIKKWVTCGIACMFVAVTVAQSKPATKTDVNDQAPTAPLSESQSEMLARLLLYSDTVAGLERQAVAKLRDDARKTPIPKDANAKKIRAKYFADLDRAEKQLKENPRRIPPLFDRLGSFGTIDAPVSCDDIVSDRMMRGSIGGGDIREAFIEISTENKTSDNSYRVTGIWYYADTRSYTTVLGATRKLPLLRRVDDSVIAAFERARPAQYEAPSALRGRIYQKIIETQNENSAAP